MTEKMEADSCEEVFKASTEQDNDLVDTSDQTEMPQEESIEEPIEMLVEDEIEAPIVNSTNEPANETIDEAINEMTINEPVEKEIEEPVEESSTIVASTIVVSSKDAKETNQKWNVEAASEEPTVFELIESKVEIVDETDRASTLNEQRDADDPMLDETIPKTANVSDEMSALVVSDSESEVDASLGVDDAQLEENDAENSTIETNDESEEIIDENQISSELEVTPPPESSEEPLAQEEMSFIGSVIERNEAEPVAEEVIEEVKPAAVETIEQIEPIVTEANEEIKEEIEERKYLVGQEIDEIAQQIEEYDGGDSEEQNNVETSDENKVPEELNEAIDQAETECESGNPMFNEIADENVEENSDVIGDKSEEKHQEDTNEVEMNLSEAIDGNVIESKDDGENSNDKEQEENFEVAPKTDEESENIPTEAEIQNENEASMHENKIEAGNDAAPEERNIEIESRADEDLIGDAQSAEAEVLNVNHFEENDEEQEECENVLRFDDAIVEDNNSKVHSTDENTSEEQVENDVKPDLEVTAEEHQLTTESGFAPSEMEKTQATETTNNESAREANDTTETQESGIGQQSVDSEVGNEVSKIVVIEVPKVESKTEMTFEAKDANKFTPLRNQESTNNDSTLNILETAFVETVLLPVTPARSIRATRAAATTPMSITRTPRQRNTPARYMEYETPIRQTRRMGTKVKEESTAATATITEKPHENGKFTTLELAKRNFLIFELYFQSLKSKNQHENVKSQIQNRRSPKSLNLKRPKKLKRSDRPPNKSNWTTPK